MALTITITNAGRAAIVNANNTGTAPVTIAEIGLSATAHTPAPTNTALLGEIKRIPAVSGLVVADDTIHVSMSDTSADAYELRSLGLYLADGTLFAIYGQATPILVKVAASIAALSVDVVFADIDAEDLTFGNASFINPPASQTVAGVVQLATPEQAVSGLNNSRVLTPFSIAGILATIAGLLGRTVTGTGLASGGGDLSANRQITVTAASVAEANAAANNTKALTPASIADLVGNIATLFSRTISGGGLASGGGNLNANRTITVTAASAAEANAGSINTKALTPASLVDILASIAGKVGLQAVSFGSNTISLRLVLNSSNTLLIQGGTGFMSQNSSGFITFPLTYSTAPLCIVDGGPTDFGEGDVHGTALATTSGKAIVNGGNDPAHYSWLAIGRV